MKRLLVLLVVLAVGVPLAVWVSGAGAHGSGSAATTVHVVEHAVTDSVSKSTQADKPGNVLTFANPVYDAADKKKVGSDNGFCVRTAKEIWWECMWTTVLPAGQLTVQGLFSDAGNRVLAVTGGTGAYSNARGSMNLNYHNKKGTKFDFIFHIT